MIKNVNLQARNCEVEDSMREHFENKLNSLEKMSSHPTDAEVRIKHERGHYVAEITLFGHGTVTRAEERDSDLRAAFDTATQKLQSQMRRYKDKLQETGRRHNNRDDQNGVVLHPKTSDEVTSAATIAPLSMPARQYDEVAPGADGGERGRRGRHGRVDGRDSRRRFDGARQAVRAQTDVARRGGVADGLARPRFLRFSQQSRQRSRRGLPARKRRLRTYRAGARLNL